MSATANAMLQIASADNLRLANIVEAADKLAVAIKEYVDGPKTFAARERINAALDAFKVVRQGQ